MTYNDDPEDAYVIDGDEYIVVINEDGTFSCGPRYSFDFGVPKVEKHKWQTEGF